MKTRIYSIFSLALVVALLSSFSFLNKNTDAPEWSVDYAHSSITFTISHFFTPIQGAFDKYEGKLMFDPEDLGSSYVEFKVDIESINTKNGKRDGHLKSADFFNAKEWPTMKFVSEKFETDGENKFLVHGKMTIRDVTKDVKVPFELLGVRDHLMKKGMLVGGIKAEFKLNRNEYGVGTGDWAATAVIGEEVNITLFFEVNRPS